ncbi:MAG: DNA methyltransferase [Prevotella sp.]|nr:DNA methyltransferase [Candidatus Equicola faecalis]
MATENLSKAKNAKQDEFYTQYADIEKEVNAYLEFNPDTFKDKTILLPCDDPEWSNFTRYFALHFEDLGLRKLISTSYAPESKRLKQELELTLFETESPQFDPQKAQTKGKIFVLDRDIDGDGKIDINDLQWEYLEGDGDFRSAEVKAFRDKADIIITNPPFSLFREFFAWLMESGKEFLVICNKNSVTYKEIFPYIKNNKVWVGTRNWAGGMWFETTNLDDFDKIVCGIYMKNTPSIWFTNLEHGRRHQPLSLMTMADNLKFSRHKEIKGKQAYDKYDNYDVIEVPYTDAIPSDYDGVMGVPISFLDKYCPEQFEIVGMAEDNGKGFSGKESKWDGVNPHCVVNGKNMFKRIFIRKKR